MSVKKPFHIAIDGPVAAGKGTIARLVAQKLGFLYVDTGAMYRVAAYLALQNNVSLDDEAKLVELIEQSSMDMRNPNEDERDGRLTTVFLDKVDVSWKIRTEDVSAGASKVATLPEMRRVLVSKQQKIAADKDVVMEGRDITYRVLPNADVKIFLTADDITRAKRRHLQLQIRGDGISFDEVYSELLKRDHQDMSRDHDPLKITDDVWQIDTSDLSIEQVVDLITAKVLTVKGNYE
jgi:cytidylate kinase